MSNRTEQDKLNQLLNASGFAFQLALEATVRAAKLECPWKIAAREHPWSTATSRGYLDLVLSNADIHLAIECKRPRDAVWMFLMPDDQELERSHARIRWTDTVPHRPSLSEWGDIQVHPRSPESDFCAVRGQGETDSPMLERLASGIAEAAEGLSADFLVLHRGSRVSSVIIPVIVTTATLWLAQFDPAKVDLKTGEIDVAQFKAVPHVRFRKSLTGTNYSDVHEPERLEDLSAGSQRTVFVVNAGHFIEWLGNLQVGAASYGSPWESARRQADAGG